MRIGNLAARAITAAAIAPLLVAVVLVGPPWAWFVCVLLAASLGAAELFTMTHPDDRVAQSAGVVSTIAFSSALYFYSDDRRVILSLLLLVPIVGVLVPLWRLGKVPTAGLRLMAGVAGPLYVGGLLTTVALVRKDAGPGFTLLTLTFAWFADTAGYFAGKHLGKAKLYETISPKKTRAGFWGATVGSILAALVAHVWYLPELPAAHAVALGFVVGVLGQLGDLSESLLKRATGMKDSGTLLPGHGGMLDRIDALLIVSPCVYLYCLWIG